MENIMKASTLKDKDMEMDAKTTQMEQSTLALGWKTLDMEMEKIFIQNVRNIKDSF